MTNLSQNIVLDRVPSIPDPVRMERYAIRELLADRAPRSYTWGLKTHLDQGREGACVGHGWTHEALAKPVVVDFRDLRKRLPEGFAHEPQQFAFDLYHWAQRHDQWTGEGYDGTSVVAGAQGMQAVGALGEYRWANNLNDALTAISWHGPAVLGLDWWTGMFSPDSDGHIHKTGAIEGGHCILANGVSVANRTVRLENSWGTDWGKGGACLISWEDFGALLQSGMEVCVPVVRSALPLSTTR